MPILLFRMFLLPTINKKERVGKPSPKTKKQKTILPTPYYQKAKFKEGKK